MKKKISLALCAGLVFVAAAYGKDSTMAGWISDSKCAAKGANAAHEACTKKCIESGEKAVFVNDKDGKVLAIENPDAVKDHVGHHVEVKGSVKDGAVHVESVNMIAQK